VWRLAVDPESDALGGKLTDALVENPALERTLHSVLKKVGDAVEELRFNTAISEMMVFVNEATKAEALPRAWFESFVKVLYPFAPHVSEELWQRLGHSRGLVYESWPRYDQAKLKVDTITIAVQVSGKTRGTIDVPVDISEQDAIATAKADPKVARHLEGKTIRREIYVPGRLVNLVAT
jgi:leucyl-tRNA synthetase